MSDYQTTYPFPTKDNMPVALRQAASDAEAALGAAIAAKEEWFRSERKKYGEAVAVNTAMFWADLEEQHGMAGHPKAARLREKAWADGHSAGYGEVAIVYAGLVGLVKS